jgi:cell division protein FtsB
MKRQSGQNNKRRAISARTILTAVVAILIFSLLLSSVINLMGKYIAMRGHIKSLKQEQLELQQKKDIVSNMNKDINTVEGQERIFRDKYRLIKPGEGMIVITNEGLLSENAINKKSKIRRFWDSIVKGLGFN